MLGKDAALAADETLEFVGLLKQSIRRTWRAVRYDGVAFHLAKAQAAAAGAALHGLARQDLDGAARARVNLVLHHVAQLLVVSGTDKDARIHHPPRHAVDESLVSFALVAHLV